MTLSSVPSALLTRRLLAVVGRAPVPQASVLCQRVCFGLCGSGSRRSRTPHLVIAEHRAGRGVVVPVVERWPQHLARGAGGLQLLKWPIVTQCEGRD